MTFLNGAAEGVQLIVGNRLKTMLSHQPQTFQLHPFNSISFGLMLGLKRFHGLGVQRMVGHEHLAQISFHNLSLSPWLSHLMSCQHYAIQAT